MENVDINILLSQMAEMQKQLNELQSLKKDVKEIKEISSIGEDVAKEVAEEINQLKDNGVIIPHLEKQAESVLYPKRKEKNGLKRVLLESEIKEAREKSRSARECAKKLGVCYTTYKKYARMYGVHVVCDPTVRKTKDLNSTINPNKGKYPLSKILSGKCPNFPIHRLKDKLIRSGTKKAECEQCGYKERRITDGKIPLLLNFEDGNRFNHLLENLKILCYNCTFCNGRGYIRRGTVHFNMDPDVIQGAKKPIRARF
jgi:hypothetical protein